MVPLIVRTDALSDVRVNVPGEELKMVGVSTVKFDPPKVRSAKVHVANEGAALSTVNAYDWLNDLYETFPGCA